jgi:FkbM family methyltransferase
MNYLKQYFRDVRALFGRKHKNSKLKLFIVYNRLCIKNIVLTKILKIKTTKEKVLGLTIYYDNFNSFFAMFAEIFLHEIYGDIKLKEKTPTIVDCGANIGIATLYFKYYYPSANIVSFEPDPGTFKLLKKNCEANKLSNVALHNKALSDKKGKIKFYSYGNFEGSPGNTIHKKWVNFNNVLERNLDCVTLSSINLKKIDLLKIDVEGAEGKIIKDLSQTNHLSRVKNINLEYHYGTENEENSLGQICLELEKAKFDFVINPDSLVGDNNPVDKFIENRIYVLVMNCVRKK